MLFITGCSSNSAVTVDINSFSQESIQLYLEDVSEREISRRSGKARNTVRKYIKEYEKSRLEDIRNLPITEEVMKSPTYQNNLR